MNVDVDLITACINRERRAEYDLYKMTYSYLMSICIRYTKDRDEAQESLNIGFLKILNNLEKYQPGVPFKAWIRKVMVNVLIDEYRKQKKHSEHIEYVEEYWETQENSDTNHVLSKMGVDLIHSFIRQLPAVSQKVFNLFVIDGFSHKEIAQMLNMSEGTSKWHLNNSRQKLKEKINNPSSHLKVVA